MAATRPTETGSNWQPERERKMPIWRYPSRSFAPPEVSFRDWREDDNAWFFRAAHLCEPLPDRESMAIPTATVRAVPVFARAADPAAKRAAVQHWVPGRPGDTRRRTCLPTPGSPATHCGSSRGFASSTDSGRSLVGLLGACRKLGRHRHSCLCLMPRNLAICAVGCR